VNDIVVEGYPNATYKHYAVAQYPSYHVRDLKNKFDLSTLNNLPTGSDDYLISINKILPLRRLFPEDLFMSLRKTAFILTKELLKYLMVPLKEYSINYNAINGTSPISFYTGDPTASIINDNEKLNILIFCDTNKDRLAYEALKLQLSSKIFTIYNHSGSSVLNYTTETSINTGEYNGVTAVYHNWGQFLYNEASDVVTAAGSSNQQPPAVPL
jgi:hypothetical protein